MTFGSGPRRVKPGEPPMGPPEPEGYRFAPRAGSPHRVLASPPFQAFGVLLALGFAVGLWWVLAPVAPMWGWLAAAAGAVVIAALVVGEVVIRRREVQAWREGDRW
jgi:uncharacterized membrane protein YedE/YeeE